MNEATPRRIGDRPLLQIDPTSRLQALRQRLPCATVHVA